MFANVLHRYRTAFVVEGMNANHPLLSVSLDLGTGYPPPQCLLGR